MTRRYHTKSGSVYEVVEYSDGTDEAFHVQRLKLGEKYDDRPEKAAKRRADGLDEGRFVPAFHCYGVGYQALISVDGKSIVTNVVTEIEEVV